MRDALKLSILIPMVPRRLASGVSVELLRSLCSQAEGKPVEVLGMLDNKRRTLGEKRNDLLGMAKGEYVAFVGDDDAVEDNYVDALRKAAESKADVLTFRMVSVTGPYEKLYRFFLTGGSSPEADHIHHGLPMDICAWRREIATQVTFPKVSAGEDGVWSRDCAKLAKTQHEIGRVLYRRRVNPLTSETSRGGPCAKDTVWKDGQSRRARK